MLAVYPNAGRNTYSSSLSKVRPVHPLGHEVLTRQAAEQSFSLILRGRGHLHVVQEAGMDLWGDFVRLCGRTHNQHGVVP